MAATFRFEAKTTDTDNDPYVEIKTGGKTFPVQPNDSNGVPLSDGGLFTLRTSSGVWTFRRAQVLEEGSITAGDKASDAALAEKLKTLFFRASESTGGGISPGTAAGQVAIWNGAAWQPSEILIDESDPDILFIFPQAERPTIVFGSTSTGAEYVLNLGESDRIELLIQNGDGNETGLIAEDLDTAPKISLYAENAVNNFNNRLTVDANEGTLIQSTGRINGQPLSYIMSGHQNKTTGVQPIFTNTSGKNFYILEVRYYPVLITNPVGNGTISIGTDDPDYQNEFSDYTPQYDYDILFPNLGGAPTPALGMVLNGTTLSLNSKVADGTGDSFDFNILVIGLYQ